MATFKRMLTRGLLVAAGALAGLVAAEVGFRLWSSPGHGRAQDLVLALATPMPEGPKGSATLADLLQPSPDPNRVYELRPGLQCVFKGAEVSINSLGMRDREVAIEKPPGTRRVVGVGDSVMFGWGVRAEDSYMRVVEELLGPSDPAGERLECLNFAVPGYNTAMQVALFTDLAVRFDPDAVVIHFVNNDLDLPRFMLEPVDRWTLDRIWLVDLARGGWFAAADRGGWVSPREVARMGDRRGARVRAKYAHLAGEGPFRRAMADLAGEARARSIPVVFLTLQTEGEPWETGAVVAREHGFRVAVAGPRFVDFMALRGIESSRAGWTEAFSVSREDPHPNATGHRIFADSLAEALVEVGIGKPQPEFNVKR